MTIILYEVSGLALNRGCQLPIIIKSTKKKHYEHTFSAIVHKENRILHQHGLIFFGTTFVLPCPHPIRTSHLLKKMHQLILRRFKHTSLVVILAVRPKIIHFNDDIKTLQSVQLVRQV